jgi:hypothetical protein
MMLAQAFSVARAPSPVLSRPFPSPQTFFVILSEVRRQPNAVESLP